ncbi:variant erythrocyte surface antigen-1 family protein [Babesia divergens]|uniref:Variant erythrocyte surface antigen-1 family protein n=1 Tax=Babesia divergens TaxID=32595 RepID=A0AAD9GBC5_BABDI|nr:variant erythrocyte surface antigen-1 family protein [Babesia divergens]
MVCYMYYTDVFVGQNDNINNLKDALEAELKESGLKTDDLTQLVHGLCLFMGYPSCVCSLKVNLDKSLQDISKKLKKDFKAVQSCVSILNFDLNCNSCNSNEILCKCCVISCIKELREKCPCLSNPSQSCQCKDPKGKCCKDFLSGLEACLSLLNLKTDLEGCTCTGDCCKTGTCTQSCPLCSPNKFPDNAMTGLGICPMNPKKLAERLEGYFKPKTGGSVCDCTCKGSESCCCLACDKNMCVKACSCNTSGCSCDKALKASQGCPRKTFCSKINSIKVASDSDVRTCCSGGSKCHCEVDKKCQPGSSGQKCCIEKDGRNYKHSLKCMLRRLVSYFKSLETSSSPDIKNFKNCCELLCVLKTCEFLKGFLTKGKCGKCTSGNSKCSSSGTSSCCKGDSSKCASNPNCCVGCQECCALKFRKAFSDLRFAGPCGQNLYRALDDFLNFIRFVFLPKVKDLRLENKIKEARDKCSQCKTGSKSGQHSSCPGCKSGTSCDGCKDVLEKLQAHKDVLSLMTRGYSSAYSSEASWNSLCRSVCPCQRFPLTPCPAGGCCDACPQRKAAKIFLGMLPCLYYGLKIVFDRSKYNSGFAGWHDISVSNGNPSSDLGKFLSAWGFQTIESSGSSTIHMNPSIQAMVLPVFLKDLFSSGSSVNFKNLYENCKIYFTSSSSPSLLPSPSSKPSHPKTVRSMLLWLYGLPYTSGFHDLVSRCKSLCLPFGNSFHPDAFCYYIYTCCFILPVAIISSIEDSQSAQKAFSSSSSSEFFYPSDSSALADMFFDHIRKVYIALTFLKFQCKRVPGQAGWQYCWYGKSCKTTGTFSSPSCCSTADPSSQGYLCTASGSNQNVHEHCRGGECINANGGSCTSGHNKAHSNSNNGNCKPCPHPLVRFLCDSDSQSPSSPFRLPFSIARIDFSQNPPVILPSSDKDFLTMGFSQGNLPSPGRNGLSLGHVLAVFCESGFYPLTRLVQFILCVSRTPPETLGELFAFFKKFVYSDVFTSKFASYVDGEPGTYRGEYLRIAVQRLFNHSSGSHPYDLKSLYDCSSTKGFTCGKYLFPLYNVDGVFTPELCGMYLSWVCHLTKDFKALLEEFHEEAKGKFSCCLSSSCEKIVECPCALPFIYSWGFTFNSPKNLNCVTNGGNSRHGRGGGKHSEGDSKCTQKSCADFVSQLEKVAGKDSPLSLLLSEIERFIWSIRLPFFFGFIYVWFFVLSYFCYVILIKLDTFHTGSHLHLPRSFKILPSTLFSDASSKLKDLSYFTL